MPVQLHDLNRQRLVQRLKDKKVSEKAVVLLEGGKSSDFQRYSSDVCNAPFRQVSHICCHLYVLPLLQRISIACYAERCISYSKSVRPSVCPSVRHTLALSQNDSSYDHGVFTGG